MSVTSVRSLSRLLLIEGQKQRLWGQPEESLIDTLKSEYIHMVENIT